MAADPTPLGLIIAGLRGPDGRPLRRPEQARWLAQLLDARIRNYGYCDDPAAMLGIAVSAHNMAGKAVTPNRRSPTMRLLDRYRGVIDDVEAIALMVGYLREAAAQREMLCHASLFNFVTSHLGPPPTDPDDASPADRP